MTASLAAITGPRIVVGVLVAVAIYIAVECWNVGRRFQREREIDRQGPTLQSAPPAAVTTTRTAIRFCPRCTIGVERWAVRCHYCDLPLWPYWFPWPFGKRH